MNSSLYFWSWCASWSSFRTLESSAECLWRKCRARENKHNRSNLQRRSWMTCYSDPAGFQWTVHVMRKGNRSLYIVDACIIIISDHYRCIHEVKEACNPVTERRSFSNKCLQYAVCPNDLYALLHNKLFHCFWFLCWSVWCSLCRVFKGQLCEHNACDCKTNHIYI